MNREIPIIIPAYEPDERLIELLNKLVMKDVFLVLVDDGSGEQYKKIFNEAEQLIGRQGVVIHHEVNKGKGRALKTAFSYILQDVPEAIGTVTADSDGQHTPKCIDAITDALRENPNDLILGVRNFKGAGIPWKSRFGNSLTEKIFSYVAGIHVTDTQTGLRGIPAAFMKQLLEIPGERFEFETQMLLECAGRYHITEIPIETIYDSADNHQTHFNPVVDSIKIYKILGKRFLKYIFASFSSSILDLILFSVFCALFRNRLGAYVIVGTVFARILSATYNYIVNYKVVFKSKENHLSSGFRYFVLAVVQMCLSAFLVTLFVQLFKFIPEVVTKAIVDTCLFFVSYYIQQKFVFTKGKK